jgi:peptidoglycan/LPS O-acetylase OafA/YrhL
MGLFSSASAMRATWLEAAAEWLGAASLGIFVLHPFFQGATRVVLARLTATHAVLPNVLVPTAVAVLGPALLWHYREPLRIGFLFEFPWGGKRPDNARREVEDAAAVEGPAVEEKSRLRV